MLYNNLFLTPSIVLNTSSAKGMLVKFGDWNLKYKAQISELHKLVFILIWENFFFFFPWGKSIKKYSVVWKRESGKWIQREPYAIRTNISAQLQVTRESPLPCLSSLPLFPFPFSPLVLAGLYCNSLSEWKHQASPLSFLPSCLVAKHGGKNPLLCKYVEE